VVSSEQTSRQGQAGHTLTRSRAASGVGYRGRINKQTWDVLADIWLYPRAIESNYARSYRNDIALLASLGYISVVAPDGMSYTRQWNVTAEGLYALRHHHND
jgi:hypothetical protein